MFKLLKEMKKREAIMSVICALLVLVQIYFELALPDYMRTLTELIKSAENSMNEVWVIGFKMIGCTLASAATSIACGYLAARVGAGFSYSVREKLFGHVLSLGQNEMSSLSVPSLINRTTNDITQIQMLVAMGLQIAVKSPIMAIWAILKILGKSWELSLLTAAFVVFICGSIVAIMFTVLPRFKRVQKLMDTLNRTARENLTGINVVHAFNAEEYQNKKFFGINKNLWKTQLFNQRMFSFFQPVMILGMNGLSLGIYCLGSVLLSQISAEDFSSKLSLFSDITVFTTYAMYVVMSFMMMVMIFMMFPQAQVSAGRINEVLKQKSSVVEGTVNEGKELGVVEFKNVSFAYPDSNENQLRDINFRVERGETIAFIGATGSGKTTLINLVARFFDATEGEVLVDGVNVKDYTFDALYDKLGYVSQKAIIFSGSVRENIAFGEASDEIRDDDIDLAIKLAQADEFVGKMSNGIDSHIAQSGKNLSGGQKQRLSIARALARNPEILIFDDSFSALDYRTDAALRAGLEKNLSGVTKLIVAQRIGTIRHANKIVVLDDGKIAGIGTHDELMKTCGVYREIATSQLTEEELR